MTDLYLIEKRGLYYRPKSAGYTGLKIEAGRYTLDEVAVHFPNHDSPNQDGMSYISEDDAPEFSTRCPWDLQLKVKSHREGWDQAKEAAAVWHDEAAKHDADGLEYSTLVGIPISNADELRESVEFHEHSAKAIRAMPYPGDSQ